MPWSRGRDGDEETLRFLRIDLCELTARTGTDVFFDVLAHSLPFPTSFELFQSARRAEMSGDQGVVSFRN